MIHTDYCYSADTVDINYCTRTDNNNVVVVVTQPTITN